MENSCQLSIDLWLLSIHTMEAEHTPNEFPFSSATGAELLAVPLSYATSSDGRQVRQCCITALVIEKDEAQKEWKSHQQH